MWVVLAAELVGLCEQQQSSTQTTGAPDQEDAAGIHHLEGQRSPNVAGNGDAKAQSPEDPTRRVRTQQTGTSCNTGSLPTRQLTGSASLYPLLDAGRLARAGRGPPTATGRSLPPHNTNPPGRLLQLQAGLPSPSLCPVSPAKVPLANRDLSNSGSCTAPQYHQ